MISPLPDLRRRSRSARCRRALRPRFGVTVDGRFLEMVSRTEKDTSTMTPAAKVQTELEAARL